MSSLIDIWENDRDGVNIFVLGYGTVFVVIYDNEKSQILVLILLVKIAVALAMYWLISL